MLSHSPLVLLNDLLSELTSVMFGRSANPSLTPSQTPTREEQSNRGRWFRLVRGVLWLGCFVALTSFVGDCFWNMWDHNFGLSGITQDLLLRWLAKALAEGVFLGLFLGFPVWLAREKFPPPKRTQRRRPGA